MKKVTTLDDFLVRDYLIKIFSEGEEFIQDFYKDLLAKSLLFQELLSKDRLPSLKEEDLDKILEHIFASRRRRKKILEETGIDRLKKAISDLLYGKANTWEERVEKFVKEIRGVDKKMARDIASELLHFTFPDKYVLWTSWIWDPESESGAVVFLKEEPPKRHMYGETYEEFEQIYKQIQEKLLDFGIKAKGYLFVDMFLAMIYATYVDYMTLSTMHSAKGFFPPAGVMARRLLGIVRNEDLLEV
ncbi:hypothetical protein [Thermocrinis minervae]|uniref:Uncharacterized protein n=1 Tax=Thermocrinis minervae TaxID=381751 RepID=A0A1M6SVY6_9AQUI|nr:hypothetical protein [Thermocrinis minervae]SHK48874.1 hypothetical protein SAMN05444391_1190 [Thermocrinis minervae]